jgi:hypothetical protein
LTDAVFDAVIEEFDALFRAMYDDLLWSELYGWMAQMFRWEADLRHRRWTQRPWRTDDLQRAAFAYVAGCDQFRMPPPPPGADTISLPISSTERLLGLSGEDFD